MGSNISINLSTYFPKKKVLITQHMLILGAQYPFKLYLDA